ncbi:MAG: alpha/beta fold hydrolase [Solirubrobacteraceae bacterium]
MARQPLIPRRLPVGDAETRTLEVRGDGPTIVLLHGFSDSADTWRPVLQQLERHGRHAIAVDLPGFGRATPLPRQAGILAPLDRFVGDLVRQVERGDGVVVAGNSLGAVLALRAAERDDLNLRGVAPISPAGLHMSPAALRVDRYLGAMVPMLRLARRLPVPPSVIQRGAGLAYGRFAGRNIDPSLGARYGTHLTGGLRDVRRLGAMARVLADELQTEPYRLIDIKVPVLMLWGAEDSFCLISGAQIVLDAVPGARLVPLEGCGHCAQLEAPEQIAEELLAL